MSVVPQLLRVSHCNVFVKFYFNDKSLHTKNDSEKNRENGLSAYILRYLGIIIIIIIIIMAIIDIKVKYFTINNRVG